MFSPDPFEFKKVDNGIHANTWLGKTEVLQERPIRYLQRWKSLIKALATLPESPLLIGAYYEIIVEEEKVFWTRSKRIDQPGFSVESYSTKNINTAWEKSENTFADLLETLKLLQEIRFDDMDVMLYRNDAAFLPHQHWAKDYVLFILKNGFGVDQEFLNKIPEEPKTEFVVSHGDPVMKNFIQTPDNFCLIDWEGLCVLPKGSDPAHFFSYLLFRTPPEEWLARLKPFIQVSADYTGLSAKEWGQALFWFCLREISARGKTSTIQIIDLDKILKGLNYLREIT